MFRNLKDGGLENSQEFDPTRMGNKELLFGLGECLMNGIRAWKVYSNQEVDLSLGEWSLLD